MASDPYPDLRRGTWRMKYKPHPGGPWVTVTLGRDPRLRSSRIPKSPPADLAARAAEFADLEYRAAHGLVAPAARPRPLAEYAKAYIAAYPDSHDDGSAKLAKRYVNAFVEWCGRRGHATVQSVTDAACKDYMDHRRKQIAATTMKTVRGYISGMFSRAVAEKIIPANPWGLAPAAKGAKHKKKPRFWTSEEVSRIVAACRQPWHKDLVLVLAHTGIRISGALAMEWSWIDWKGGTITVPEAHNKGGFEYKVYMSDLIHDLLAAKFAASKSDYVFVNPDSGRPYGYQGASNAIDRAVEAAGVPRGTPHDLRHTFGRRLHMAGVPQGVISSMLGHASIATTEIYTKMDPEDSIKFMRRLSLGSGPDGSAPPGNEPRPATDGS